MFLHCVYLGIEEINRHLFYLLSLGLKNRQRHHKHWNVVIEPQQLHAQEILGKLDQFIYINWKTSDHSRFFFYSRLSFRWKTGTLFDLLCGLHVEQVSIRVKSQHCILDIPHQLDILAFLVVVFVYNVCDDSFFLVPAYWTAQEVLSRIGRLIGVYYKLEGRVVVHNLAWNIGLLEGVEFGLFLDHVLH